MECFLLVAAGLRDLSLQAPQKRSVKMIIERTADYGKLRNYALCHRSIPRGHLLSKRFSVLTQYPGLTITSSLCAGIITPFTTRAGISTSLIIGGFQTYGWFNSDLVRNSAAMISLPAL